ncbi:MAG: hypothetical protein A2W91_02370 [Bacteroidetes bacterium GWF2_38_335]|nr:MAG: hypothetical protein A2W91_02370 [Bacteroidetes bacterium GWF2_38_335]OFY80693.1 MAG: hypothetical protein A2281_05385 [Bacteroidetes bacterium RIFOXYA12_FULL_38_20]HBS87040.1 hypothetical protein [Bacteroidales bacterium]
MENFNKNWLAIMLISFVFLVLGFLLGWVLKPCHGDKFQKMMHKEMMMNPHSGGGCMGGMESCCPGGGQGMFDMSMCGGDMDSLKNIDVKVTVDDEGNVTKSACCSKSKVIVKKVE